MKLIALAIGALLFASPAYAQMNSGNDLLPACQLFVAGGDVPQELHFRVGMCLGTISGASDAGQALDAFCVRSGVSLVQSVNIVLAYAETNPQFTDLPFGLLAFNALKEAFPC